MNGARKMLAAAVLGLLASGGGAQAQSAIGFAPTIGSVPDGVILNVTPVVSADRRYVRMSLNPQFIGFDHFDTFSIPAAVSGGGIAGGGFGGFGGGGFGGGGFNNMGLGGGGALSGFRDPNPPSSFAIAAPNDPVPRSKLVKGRRSGARPTAKARAIPKRRGR